MNKQRPFSYSGLAVWDVMKAQDELSELLESPSSEANKIREAGCKLCLMLNQLWHYDEEK